MDIYLVKKKFRKKYELRIGNQNGPLLQERLHKFDFDSANINYYVPRNLAKNEQKAYNLVYTALNTRNIPVGMLTNEMLIITSLVAGWYSLVLAEDLDIALTQRAGIGLGTVIIGYIFGRILIKRSFAKLAAKLGPTQDMKNLISNLSLEHVLLSE